MSRQLHAAHTEECRVTEIYNISQYIRRLSQLSSSPGSDYVLEHTLIHYHVIVTVEEPVHTRT